jgi:hypothetical protein
MKKTLIALLSAAATTVSASAFALPTGAIYQAFVISGPSAIPVGEMIFDLDSDIPGFGCQYYYEWITNAVLPLSADGYVIETKAHGAASCLSNAFQPVNTTIQIAGVGFGGFGGTGSGGTSSGGFGSGSYGGFGSGSYGGFGSGSYGGFGSGSYGSGGCGFGGCGGFGGFGFPGLPATPPLGVDRFQQIRPVSMLVAGENGMTGELIGTIRYGFGGPPSTMVNGFRALIPPPSTTPPPPGV